MINPILEAVVLYVSAIFIFYRAWMLRDLSKCLPASLCVIFALAAWPFFIPVGICLVGAYVVALLFLPLFWHKGLLKKNRVIWIYSLLGFLGLVYLFGTCFLFNR